MQFILSEHFKKQLKPYARKYKHFKRDLAQFLEQFDKRQAVHLRKGVYKTRMRISDMTKGKSGAFRLIIHIVETDNVLLPITLYLKNERADISADEIDEHLTIVLAEVGMI